MGKPKVGCQVKLRKNPWQPCACNLSTGQGRQSRVVDRSNKCGAVQAYAIKVVEHRRCECSHLQQVEHMRIAKGLIGGA
jgi:hypothetical protein